MRGNWKVKKERQMTLLHKLGMFSIKYKHPNQGRDGKMISLLAALSSGLIGMLRIGIDGLILFVDPTSFGTRCNRLIDNVAELGFNKNSDEQNL